MSNNELFNHSFTSAGKNKYYASEVDDYLLQVAGSYEKLNKSYKGLEKKMKTLAPAIEEYNENKNTVFAAIVRAESYMENVKAQADLESLELIKKASEEAEALLLTKKAEAEAYYFNLTHEADERIIKLNMDIETLETQAELLKEKYLSVTNEKAKEIIENAKTKAAEIVAAAYQDAKTAQEKSDEIIASTTAELNRLKAEILKYKSEIFNVVATIKPAVDSIGDGADFEFVATKIDDDISSLYDDLPEFQLDGSFDLDEFLKDEAKVSSVFDKSFEDISSVGSPEYYEKEEDDISEEPQEEQELTRILPDFSSDIFGDDDSEDEPLSFSYKTDYEGIFDDLNSKSKE